MGEAWEPLAEIVPPALPTEPVGELPTTVVTPEPTSLEPSNVVPVPEAPLSKKEGEKSLEEVAAHELREIAYLNDIQLFDSFVALCRRKNILLDEQLVDQLEQQVVESQTRTELWRDSSFGDPLLHTEITEIRQEMFDLQRDLMEVAARLPDVFDPRVANLGTYFHNVLGDLGDALAALNTPNRDEDHISNIIRDITLETYKIQEMNVDQVFPIIREVKTILEKLLDPSKVMALLDAVIIDARIKSKANRVYLTARENILAALAAQKAAQPAASSAPATSV